MDELEYRVTLDKRTFVALFNTIKPTDHECSINIIDGTRIKQLIIADGKIVATNYYTKVQKSRENAGVYQGFKVSRVISIETPIGQFNPVSLAKMRIKNRWSVGRNGWRYDFTISDMTPQGRAGTDRAKQIFALTPDTADETMTFELEIEYINTNSGDNIDTNISTYGADISSMTFEKLLSVEETPIVRLARRLGGKRRNATSLKMMLPQTIELNKRIYASLIPMKDYLVTDKADGLRAIIWLDVDGCHTIDTSAVFIDKPSTLKTTVIDCERIGDKFYAFDLLWYDGRENTAPYYERVQHLAEMIKIPQSIGIDVVCKKFYPATLKTEYGRIVDEPRDYEIDGLIFTSPAGEHYKWKQITTIDFYLVAIDQTHAFLCVGCDEKLERYMMFEPLAQIPRVTGPTYPIQFAPSTFPYIYRWEHNHPELQTGDIVELRWDATMNDIITNDSKSWQAGWKLVKVREDRRGEPNYYGNYFKIAESNWQNILYPLTIDGLNTVDRGYFVTEKSPAARAIVTFNSIVKTKLITDNIRPKVLDLAAGKGQDLARYIEAGVKELTMVDIDEIALMELINRHHNTKSSTNFTTNSSGKYQLRVMKIDLTTENSSIIARLDPPYDLIVCNLAIHYLIDSRKAAQKFVDLITACLKPGGVFIYTSFDGKKLNKTMEDMGVREWNIISNGVKKYGIERRYERYAPFGCKIGVYLPFSAGEIYEENLIDHDELNEMFGWEVAARACFCVHLNEYKEKRPDLYSQLSEEDKSFIRIHGYSILIRPL